MTRGRIAVDLGEQERLAGAHLVRRGITVVGRAALDDVGDVHVVPPEIDRLDDPGEQLARPPHERYALQILVAPRRLADEHQLGIRIPDPEDERPPSTVQLAARAVAELLADLPQALGAGSRGRRGHLVEHRQLDSAYRGYRQGRLGSRVGRRVGRGLGRTPPVGGPLPPRAIPTHAGDAELLEVLDMRGERVGRPGGAPFRW